jgi:PAP2 superfamily
MNKTSRPPSWRRRHLAAVGLALAGLLGVVSATAATAQASQPAHPAAATGIAAAGAAAASGGQGAAVSGTQAVVDWNVIALRTTLAAPLNPPLESRNVALVQAAVFDAVDSISQTYRFYGIHLPSHRGASVAAAAATAAHAALTVLYPAQQATLDASYASSLAGVPDGPAKDGGIAAGLEAAVGMLSLRSSDHSGDVVSYTPGSGPGAWIPTPPAFLPALDPGWGHVTPYLIRSGSQFRPGPPPALTSPAYTRDFNEIKSVGSAASTTRTPEQTTTARFWSLTGTQEWNQLVQQLAIAEQLRADRTAWAFAVLNMAGSDAFVACWHAKYDYNQWRPVTGIRAADTDGNPGTTADPTWTPLLPTPPFPDYIAGHTTFAGAAEVVLTAIFGPEPGILTLTSAAVPGVVRSYASFRQIAAEVVNARVWAGIHWRTSATVGRHVGEEVGIFALFRAPQRR